LVNVVVAALLVAGPSDAILEHAKGQRVTIVVEDAATVGTIASWTESSVVFVDAEGALRELSRDAITSVKLTPVPSCDSDAACQEPYHCVDGGCRIERGWIDALEDEGDARLTGGRQTLIAAGVFGTLGVILLPIGIAMEGGQISGGEGGGLALWLTGTTFLSVGVMTGVFGVIFYGLGKSKLRRVERYRSRPELIVGAGPTGLSLRGRF
jgi:hypothetical protein